MLSKMRGTVRSLSLDYWMLGMEFTTVTWAFSACSAESATSQPGQATLQGRTSGRAGMRLPDAGIPKSFPWLPTL